MKPLSIAICVAWMNGHGHGNYIGDHAIAEGWAKYLRRRDDVSRVTVLGERIYADVIAGHDVVVHFWPFVEPVPGCKNILYLQNAFNRAEFGMDTVGVFNQVKERFDGYIFLSEQLRQACGAEGAIIPFAADTEEMFYQPAEAFAHPVCFVGSDIRGDAANNRYLLPAIPHGLVIYGGPYRDPRLQAVHRGRLSEADLPKAYSSARVNLNITHPEHAKYGVVNHRVYQILACGGTVLSDRYPEGLGDYCFTDDKEHWDGSWEDMLWLLSPERPAFQTQVDGRRDFILYNHTVKHRTDALMDYLREVL